MIKKYIPDDMIYNFDHWNRSYKSDRKNSAEIIKNAIIQPVVINPKIPGGMRSDVGVFREDNTYVMGSNMWQAHENMVAELPEYIPVAETRLVWGGELLNHYGHFITQSTARLYYYLQNQDKFDGIIFVWCWPHNIPKYMADFLELAGIPLDKIKITNQVLKVKELAVPTLSSFNNSDWTEDFLLPFKNANAKVAPAADKKIYMSRRKWGMKKAEVLGEEPVERAFRKNGFKIIHPERLPIRDQIAAIKGANEIAGVCGTALHNIIFAAGSKDKKRVIMLNRTEVFNIQFMLNEMVNADMDVISASNNFIPVSHADGPFIIGMTRHLREFFHDNKMNDFGIEFRPEKYARKFLREYLDIYSFPDFYQDLRDQGGNKIESQDFMDLVRLANFPKLQKIFFRIMSHISPTRHGRLNADYKFKALDKLLKRFPIRK